MNAPPTFTAASLLVLGGGAVGSWLRFSTGRLWLHAVGPVATAFPWATLIVNILGSFCMGLLVGWLARQGSGNESWRLLIGVGLLGGYTTFSSFALEVALFIERGALGMAALYVGVSLAAGFTALFAGLFLIRALA